MKKIILILAFDLFGCLVCFCQIGTIDSSFGTNGNTVNFPWADEIAVQSNDKILIAGGAGINFGLARFKSNGKVDSTFGSNGRATGTADLDAWVSYIC